MTIKIRSTVSFINTSYKKRFGLKQKINFIIMFGLLISGNFVHAQTTLNGQIGGTIITNDGNAGQGVIVINRNQ
ncbi:MAG: hypothetical protein ABI554_11855 [Flavobacterium sp.]